MREPAVLRGAMPMLHSCRHLHHIAWKHALRRLAFELAPSFAIDADEDLPAATRGMVDVPVVAASRFECHVVDDEWITRCAHLLEVGTSGEVLRVAVVRFAHAEEPAVFLLLCLVTRGIGGIHFLCHRECRPCVRPACVESDMRKNRCHFVAGHAVGAGGLKMVFE